MGRVMAALDRLKLADDTLFIFSSDNGGCSWVGYDYSPRDSLNGHKGNGILRGEKGSIWEGGTREPFIVRWPSHVPSGMVSPALVSQTDLLASLARLIGAPLVPGSAGDSMDVLDALLGKSQTGRHELIEHRYGVAEKDCALRVDQWKWINGQLYQRHKPPLFRCPQLYLTSHPAVDENAGIPLRCSCGKLIVFLGT